MGTLGTLGHHEFAFGFCGSRCLRALFFDSQFPAMYCGPTVNKGND